VQFSDEELVEEVRKGSQLAFGLLMKRYERLVFRIAMNHVKNPDSAMDVTQNAFIKTYEKLDSYTGSGPFKAWLLRITYNESLNWIRRARKDQLTESLTEKNAPVLHAVQENEMGREEDQALIRTGLVKLNARQQLAISLRYFEGFSLREIAAVLECSDGSVKSILFRSLEKLRNTITIQKRGEYAQLS
jgi:RNA polymerase sigma-70 factor (ECF subfamily)